MNRNQRLSVSFSPALILASLLLVGCGGQESADKNAQVAIYRRSGSMSCIAARTMVDLGYTDVWNLDGGMIAWEASGRSLISQ